MAKNSKCMRSRHPDKSSGRTNFGRRHFLKLGSAASLGLATGSLWLPKVLHAGINETSRVVVVRHDQVLEGSVIQPDIVRVMIDAGIQALTDTTNPSDAWHRLFPDISSDLNIGIKVNTINCNYLPSHPEVAIPIAQSLATTSVGSSNYPENNVVIWDRWAWELTNAGYTLNESTDGIRCFASNSAGIGYNQDYIYANGSAQQVSRIYTDYTDQFINLSCMKNHTFAGMTFSLKNHLGTINDPEDLHGSWGSYCDPYIPALNAALINQYGDRQKLCICDAIVGIRSGGPMGPPQFIYKGLIMSQDPVALDTICKVILEENGCNTGFMATHIETASQEPYNLGNYNQADIERIDIENPTAVSRSGFKGLPTSTSLERNYPEPFNASTTIPVLLEKQSNVNLAIFNLHGRRVANVFNGMLPAGRHNLSWNGLYVNGRDAASGRYFVKMKIDKKVHSRGITLLR